MITYSWNIKNLITTDTEIFSNLVEAIHWELIAIEGEYSNIQHKVLKLAPSQSDVFTSYENLTEEQVLSWLLTEMSEEEKNHWKNMCVININKQKNPGTTTQLPWA